MTQNLDIIIDTLVRKATDSTLKEEDWGTNIQIIDYLERNPDDMAPLVLQAIVSTMASKDERSQFLALCVGKNKTNFPFSCWICASNLLMRSYSIVYFQKI